MILNVKIRWVSFLQVVVVVVCLISVCVGCRQARYKTVQGRKSIENSTLPAGQSVSNGGSWTSLPGGRGGSTLPGRNWSTLPGRRGTTLPGRNWSTLPGRRGTTLPGRNWSTLPGRLDAWRPTGSTLPRRSGMTIPRR
jgi:hypothetical protein